jgi:glycosyltransferase involved in cell wall biosynthesis
MRSVNGDGRVTVVRIIDRLNVGGPAIHAVLTTRGLDQKRFRTVLVIGSIEPGEADMGDLARDLEVVVVPSLGRELRPLRDVATAWQLMRILRREKPAIVHTHKAKAGAIGRLVAQLAGVPVRVHTYHGHVFHGYFGAAKTALFLGIERTLARTTHRLIALSDGLLRELSERYAIAPRDKFTVVPLGFDLARFAAADAHRGRLRAELGLAADVTLVGIVGRMVPVKDHATFVRAAALLPAHTHFVFVGGGELEREVRALAAELGLGARAHFLGWRRDLERIYPDLDAFALSSVNEGTPVTLIEAMSAGVPVASTTVGGVADVLRHGARGELATAGDPQSLADAITRALSQSARARARNIRSEVLAEFDGARLCRDLEHLYDTLLDGERA